MQIIRKVEADQMAAPLRLFTEQPEESARVALDNSVIKKRLADRTLHGRLLAYGQRSSRFFKWDEPGRVWFWEASPHQTVQAPSE